jgi:2-oxoglutarate ferredoxin oxidoreductase subunit delta
VDFCPKNVLFLDENNKVEVRNIDDCTGCMMCEYRCPDYAIKVEVNE